MKKQVLSWLKQQELLFINNNDRREFFLDLASYYNKIISGNSTNPYLDILNTQQSKDNARFALIVHLFEEKIEVLKKSVEVVVAGCEDVDIKNTSGVHLRKYDQYKTGAIISSGDRLWNMYLEIQAILDDLYLAKKPGLDQFINEIYLTNPVGNPLWKFYLTMENYDQEKFNFIAIHQRSDQYANEKIKEIYRALYLKDDYEKKRNEYLREFEVAVEKAKKENKQLDPAWYSQYREYSDMSDEYLMISLINTIFQDKKPEKDSVHSYLIEKTLVRDKYLRHFLTLNNYLIHNMQDSTKALPIRNKTQTKSFDVPNLISVTFEPEPFYTYVGVNKGNSDSKPTHGMRSEKNLYHLLLFKLIRLPDYKMTHSDMIHYLETEKPEITNTQLASKPMKSRLGQYVSDIKNKYLSFSDEELGVDDTHIFLKIVRTI